MIEWPKNPKEVGVSEIRFLTFLYSTGLPVTERLGFWLKNWKKPVRKNVKKSPKNAYAGPNFDASYLGNGSSFFDSVKSSWSHIFHVIKYLKTR